MNRSDKKSSKTGRKLDEDYLETNNIRQPEEFQDPGPDSEWRNDPTYLVAQPVPKDDVELYGRHEYSKPTILPGYHYLNHHLTLPFPDQIQSIIDNLSNGRPVESSETGPAGSEQRLRTESNRIRFKSHFSHARQCAYLDGQRPGITVAP